MTQHAAISKARAFDHSGRFSIAASAALVVLLIASSTAAAHLLTWYSNSESAYLYTGYTTWTTGDTHRTRITSILWDGTRASNMRHMASQHGNRFTLNVTDLDEHMSALNTYWTSLPMPYFDRDFYSSKCPEAEITSESASFPTAGTYYFGNLYFTHWYWIGAGWDWQWDNYGGRYSYTEELSAQYWWTSDKWDVSSPTWGGEMGQSWAYVADPTYPAKARPANDPPISADPCGADGGPTAPVASSLSQPSLTAAPNELAVGFGLTRDQNGPDTRTIPDLSDGLASYVEKAHLLARTLVAAGPGRAILTFAEPLSRGDLAELSQLGISIHTIEAVSDAAAEGQRMTFGDTYWPEAFDLMESLAAEESVEMLGVTSAEATIQDISALEALLSDPKVFLVDMSAEQVRRADPTSVEVGTNDLYWFLAGWEPLPSDRE